MHIDIKLSSKGQVVIPKDVRDAMHLEAGATLRLSRQGQRIVLEVPDDNSRPRITYEEFRRRVPKYEGAPATIEEMNAAVDKMFAERRPR